MKEHSDARHRNASVTSGNVFQTAHVIFFPCSAIAETVLHLVNA